MIYEFIATISAGFAMAGLALIIRHLSKLTGMTTPRWLIPVCAGLGMLGFQIHQEYNWQEQQTNRLPEQVTVVKMVKGSEWFRPWSYIKPQTIRFMAVNNGQNVSNEFNNIPELASDSIKRVNIYLFERRLSTKIVPQLINCSKQQHADLIGVSETSSKQAIAADNTNNTSEPQQAQIAKDKLVWMPLETQDELYKTVCTD